MILLSTTISACSASGKTRLSMMPLDKMSAEVQAASLAVQKAYRFAAANPDVMKTIPCYCGCDSLGHTSNYDCYVSSVKAAWGDEPYNQYGATETADIAAEYELCRRLHIFEDLLFVEVVDEQYRPVPRGEYGAKLLVMTLFSRTQPLIRYDINDSVMLSAEPCPICGLPFVFIEGIQGRMEDALSMQAVKGGQILIQPLVFNRVMDILPVSGWQVIQETDLSLKVLLSGVRNGIHDETVADAIRKELTSEGALAPMINVRHVAEIPKNASGKAPLIKSNIHQDHKVT